MADRRVLLGIVLVVLAWACCSMLAFVSSSMPVSLHSTELLSAPEAPEASPELRPLGVWSQKGLDPGTAQLLLNQNLLKHVLDVRVQNQNALRHQLKKRVRGLKALKKQPEQAVVSGTLQAGAAGALASATFATARAVQSMAATMQAELNEMKPHATTSHLARTRRGPKKLRHRTRLDDDEEDGTNETVDEGEDANGQDATDEKVAEGEDANAQDGGEDADGQDGTDEKVDEGEDANAQDGAEDAEVGTDEKVDEGEDANAQDEGQDPNAPNSHDEERPQAQERPQNDEDEEEDAGGLPFGKKTSIVSSPGASIGVTVEGDNNAVSMGGHDAITFPGKPGGVCGCCGQSGCGCCQGGPAGGGCSCCGHSGCGCCHSGGVSHSRGAVAGSSNDHHSEIQIEEHLEKREDAFEEHLEKMIEESEKQQEKEEEEHKTDHGLEEEEEHLKEEEKEFEEQKEQEEEEVQKEKDDEEERLEEKEEHENTKETPGVTPNMHIEVKPIISVNTNGGGLQHILGGCGGGGDCSGCAGNNSGCAEGASHSAANHDFEAMLTEHLDKWMEDHSKSDEPKSDEPKSDEPAAPVEPVEPVEPVPDYVCDNPDCPEDSLAKCKVYVAGFNEDGELIISKDDEPKEGQNFYVSQCGTCDGSAGLASRSGNVCKPTEPEEKPVEDEKGGDEPEEKALEMAEESFIPEPCPPGSHRVTAEEECIPEPCPSGSHRVTEGEDCIPVPCPPGSHRLTPGEECEPEPSSPSAKTVPPDYICHNPDCPENQEAKCKVYKAAFSDDGGLVISEEDKLQEGMFYFSSCGTCDDSGHNNRLGNACNPTSEPGVQTSEPGVAESEPGVAEPKAEPENKPTVPADCPDCPEPDEPEAEPENICFHPDCPDKKCRVYKNAAGAFYSECEACGNSVKSSNIEKFKTVEGTIVTFEGNACTHDLTPTPGAKEKEEEAPPGFQPASAPVEPPPTPYAPPEPCPEGTRGPGDPPCPRAEEVKALEAVLEQKKDEERMENAKKAVLDQEIEFLKGELENDKENLKSDKAELKMETTKLAKYKTDFQQQQEKEEKMHHSKMLAEKQVLKDLQGSFSPVEKILDPVEEEQMKKEENRQAEENQAFEAKQKEEKQFEVKKEEAEEGVIEAEGKRISQLEGKMQEIELSEQSSTENPVFKPY